MQPEKRRPAIRRRLLLICGQKALEACMEQHPDANEQAQQRFKTMLNKVLERTAQLVEGIETPEKRSEADERQLEGEPLELSRRLDLEKPEDSLFDNCAQSILHNLDGVSFSEDQHHQIYDFSVTTTNPQHNLHVTVRRSDIDLGEDMSYLGDLDPTGVRYSLTFGLVAKHDE